MRVDEVLIGAGVSLPAGGSLPGRWPKIRRLISELCADDREIDAEIVWRVLQGTLVAIDDDFLFSGIARHFGNRPASSNCGDSRTLAKLAMTSASSAQIVRRCHDIAHAQAVEHRSDLRSL